MSDILREAPAEAVSENVHAPVTSTPIHALPRQPRQLRPRRVLSGLASLAAVLLIAIIAASLFSSRAHPRQAGAPSNLAIAPGSESGLLDVAMVSSTEGWAVGYSATLAEFHQSNGTFSLSSQDTVLMMHYLHGKWSPVHLSISGSSRLTSISMLSATDGWAIGSLDDKDETGLFLHYDGHSWKQVLNTNAPGVNGAHRLYMLSDTDGWAINYSVWHYDGHSWTAQPLPASLEDGTQNVVVMQDIAMTSATDGWAVGYLQVLATSSQVPDAIILHYSDGQWTVVSTINGAELKGVVMTSPDEGWAVGRHAFATNTTSGDVIDNTPMLLHYSRGAWSEVPNPLDAADSQHLAFEHISMLSDLDGWILIGTGVNFRKSATLSYDGAEWQVTRLPIKGLDTDEAQINCISMTSSRDGWAVGSVTLTKINGATPTPQGAIAVPTVVPLLLHYQDNAWTVYNP